MNYYNEFDPNASAWLRQLVKMKMIPDGIVDERSIVDVRPEELSQYAQCHFFAGIGGWSLALRLAGIPDDRPLWTGSCPCQAFSTAGKQLGFEDPRDLWPVFFKLIEKCRPAIVIGEQVEAAIRHGWLDRLQGDLEGEGYAVGAVVLGAHSVGAPHIRQRLYWGARLANPILTDSGSGAHAGLQKRTDEIGDHGYQLRNEHRDGCDDGPNVRSRIPFGRMADSADDGFPATYGGGETAEPSLSDGEGRIGESEGGGCLCRPDNWRNAAPVWCRDGVYRPVPHPQSGIFPLAYGIPRGVVHSGDPSVPGYANATQEARQMRLKGYGNAIVPQVAAEFICAFLGTELPPGGRPNLKAEDLL